LLRVFEIGSLGLRQPGEGTAAGGVIVVVQEILLILAAIAFSVPRIFSNTQRGWNVSMNALERRLCRTTCAGVVHTTKIGSPANENSHSG
jgi:hypothetical protein